MSRAIPLVDDEAVALASGSEDTPEGRAARIVAPLYADGLRRAGLTVRTAADVAADVAAARQRSKEAERRTVERQVNLGLAYARAIASGAVR